MPDLVYRITAQNLLKGELAGIKSDIESAGQASAGVGRGATAGGAAMRGLNNAMMDTRDVSRAVASVLRGDIGDALMALTGLTNSQIAAFARLGGVAGAAFAGWQIGTALRDMTGLGAAVDRLARGMYDMELRARKSTAEIREMAKAAADLAKSDMGDISDTAGADRQRGGTVGGLRIDIMRDQGASDEQIAAEEMRQAREEQASYERQIEQLRQRKADFDKQISDAEGVYAQIRARQQAGTATEGDAVRLDDLARTVNALRAQRPDVERGVADDIRGAELGRDAAVMRQDLLRARSSRRELDSFFGDVDKADPRGEADKALKEFFDDVEKADATRQLGSGLEDFFAAMYGENGDTLSAGEQQTVELLREIRDKLAPGMAP